jgi:hypothetical protein
MKRLVLCCLSLALFLPALAGGQETTQSLRDIAASTRSQTTALLNREAGTLGVPVSGQATFLDAQESIAAIIPVAGVENLTRDSLAVWTTIGVISVAGPPDAQSPSGSFSVRVKAAPGSTRGQFQIVDSAGNVVQEGELSIEDAPADEVSSADGFEAGAVTPKKGDLESSTSAFHSPGCFYPYAPYFRIYPYYYYGCHWWWYKWHWGHLRFRYCWWPYYGCCWWWRCCW